MYTRKEILRILNGAITEGNDDLWKVYVWDGNVDGFVPEVGGKRRAVNRAVNLALLSDRKITFLLKSLLKIYLTGKELFIE